MDSLKGEKSLGLFEEECSSTQTKSDEDFYEKNNLKKHFNQFYGTSLQK